MIVLASYPPTLRSLQTAGVIALILGAKGKAGFTAQSVKTLLQTTSNVIVGDSMPHTAAQGGAGLLNVENAISYTTRLSTGEIRLGDSTSFKPK